MRTACIALQKKATCTEPLQANGIAGKAGPAKGAKGGSAGKEKDPIQVRKDAQLADEAQVGTFMLQLPRCTMSLP